VWLPVRLQAPRKTRFRLAVLHLGRLGIAPTGHIESFTSLHDDSISPGFPGARRTVARALATAAAAQWARRGCRRGRGPVRQQPLGISCRFCRGGAVANSISGIRSPRRRRSPTRARTSCAHCEPRRDFAHRTRTHSAWVTLARPPEGFPPVTRSRRRARRDEAAIEPDTIMIWPLTPTRMRPASRVARRACQDAHALRRRRAPRLAREAPGRAGLWRVSLSCKRAPNPVAVVRTLAHRATRSRSFVRALEDPRSRTVAAGAARGTRPTGSRRSRHRPGATGPDDSA
jgi:hypothetical protein